MAMRFSSPTAGAVFQTGQDITFTVEVPASVTHVILTADGRTVLGTFPVQEGKAKHIRPFSGAGPRTVEAVGLDANEEPVDSVSVNIVVKAAARAGAAGDADLAKIAAFAIKAFGMNTNVVEAAVRSFASNQSDWCVSFCGWVYRKALDRNPKWGVNGFNPATGQFENWVPDMVLWAQEHGLWLRHRDMHQTDRHGNPVLQVPADGSPRPGYLLVYGDRVDFFGGARFQNYPHIGVVVSVDSNGIRTVEGNTSTVLPSGEFVSGVVNEKFPSLGKGPNTSSDPNARYVAGYIIPPQ